MHTVIYVQRYSFCSGFSESCGVLSRSCFVTVFWYLSGITCLRKSLQEKGLNSAAGDKVYYVNTGSRALCLPTGATWGL